MGDRKYSNPAKLHWYPDISCPVCGGEVNSWNKRCSRALAYKSIVCEECIAKEYGIDVEELRDTMKNHLGFLSRGTFQGMGKIRQEKPRGRLEAVSGGR